MRNPAAFDEELVADFGAGKHLDARENRLTCEMMRVAGLAGRVSVFQRNLLRRPGARAHHAQFPHKNEKRP